MCIRDSYKGGLGGGGLSGIDAAWAVLLDSLAGQGAGVNGESFMNVNDAVVKGNPQGGISCGGGSYCSAQRTEVRNNNGTDSATPIPPYEIDFGFNVYWDAWLDITGAVFSGHDIEGNETAVSNPQDWGTIYDSNKPPSP